MATTGNVQITIQDNGGASNIIVAAPSVIAVAGVSSSGTANVPVSTRSISTITSTFGYGPLTELCALLIANGATVIATKLTKNASGTASAVTHTGTGTSVVTVTLDAGVGAFDTYYVKVKVATAGTIGTSGAIQVSLDAGRTYGPVISLGTAVTYAISNTGVTLNFGVGTLVVGDTYTFSTIEPSANTAGVQAWLTALAASPYAQAGWGNMICHTCPDESVDITGTNFNSIQTTLDTLASGYLFERCMFNARDAKTPVAWGGAGETESAWMSSIISDFAATTAKRACVAAGCYNMASGIANTSAGTPVYRRPLSWAIAARKVTKDVQILSSRVKDGPLGSINVDPTSDPSDGFLYHDERANPGLDAAWFASAWTRLGQGQGFFVRSENLAIMNAPSSDFPLLAIGACFDVFCSTLVQFFTVSIDETVRTNANGTIYENDAQQLEKGATAAVANAMSGSYQPANTSIVIDRTYNVKSNSKVKVSGTFGALAYMREFDLTVQVQNPNAA